MAGWDPGTKQIRHTFLQPPILYPPSFTRNKARHVLRTAIQHAGTGGTTVERPDPSRWMVQSDLSVPFSLARSLFHSLSFLSFFLSLSLFFSFAPSLFLPPLSFFFPSPLPLPIARAVFIMII